MPLKCVIETVIKVDYSDLEEFIKAQTGHTYEIVPNEEWGNDEQHRVVLDGQLDQWDLDKWNEFKATGKEKRWLTHAIMNGLCAEGKLIAGVYLINVSW